MEQVQIIQIVYIFIIFLITCIFILLPLKVIPVDSARTGTSRKTQRIIDLCNCFAGGVFLATCFVQLVPHVEAKFAEAFKSADLQTSYCSFLMQFVSMLGFFLILLMEQAVHSCMFTTKSKTIESEQELVPVKGYVVSVSSSDNGTGSDDSEVENGSEKMRMLKIADENKPKIQKSNNKSKTRATSSTCTDPKTSHEVDPTNEIRPKISLNNSCHNHSHIAEKISEGEFSLRCIVLLFALSLHSLFEGMAVGLQDSLWPVLYLMVGISVHECVVAFALGISLVRQGVKRSTVVKISLVFSCMISVGIVIGMVVGGIHSFVGGLVSAVLQALTVGTFIYVIFVEILPAEVDRNRDRLVKVLVMFVGFAVISGLTFLMKGEHRR